MLCAAILVVYPGLNCKCARCRTFVSERAKLFSGRSFALFPLHMIPMLRLSRPATFRYSLRNELHVATDLASLFHRWREVLSFRPSLALVFIVGGSTSAALATPDGTSHWLNNDLGREEIVLPGFSPVRTSGHRVELGGHRSYDSSDHLLPTVISSQGEELVNSMELVVVVSGAERTAHAVAQVISSVDHHAELRAISATIPGVAVECRIAGGIRRCDGRGCRNFLSDKSRFRPARSRFTVPRRQGMKTMAFDPATMYNFRPFFIPDCYRGSYKSTLGFVYGDASFWWFDDDLDRSLLGDSPVTTVRCDGPALRVSQPLLARSRRLDTALIPFRVSRHPSARSVRLISRRSLYQPERA